LGRRQLDAPDDGIWEVRGGQQNFVYSKVQCWVALDRALRLATKRSLSIDFPRLASVRQRDLRNDHDQGWDPQRRTFVQYFGTEALDASNLIMPLVFFISPTTTDAWHVGANHGGTCLGQPGVSLRGRKGSRRRADRSRGTFNMCTFWLVEALDGPISSAYRRDDLA